MHSFHAYVQLINLHVPTPETQSAMHVRTQQEAPSWSHGEKYWVTDSKSVYEMGKEDTGNGKNGQGGSGVRQVYETSVYYLADWC